MGRVRPRPWQVFFALWIAMGALVLWLFYWGKPPEITEGMLARAKQVSARVVSGARDAGGRRPATTATVHLAIPPTFGITTCESFLTVDEFERLRGREVAVTVLEGPPPRCLTATAYQMIDLGDLNAPILGPMLFGAMLAWLLYYPIIRMEWSAAGALKSRWDAERAAVPVRPPPSP